MQEPASNLADVAADRVSLWSAEAQAHRDIRDLFVGAAQVTQPTRVQQQVGSETDELLVYAEPTDDQVPSLKGLVEYIQQERLGEGSTVHKHYSISRTNRQQIQTEQTVVARRGRTGQRGPKGTAGKAQTLVREGDLFLKTRVGPAGRRGARGTAGEDGATGRRGRKGARGARGVRGPPGETGVSGPIGRRGPQGERGETGDAGAQGDQGEKGDAGDRGEKGDDGERGTRGLRGDLVLVEGDTLLHRVQKNQTTRNTTHTTEQNITLQTRTVHNATHRTEQLHLHEGPHATFKSTRHDHTHRYALEAPVFHTSIRHQPRVTVRRGTHLEVFAPVFFQRIRNESRVTRPIFLFAPY